MAEQGAAGLAAPTQAAPTANGGAAGEWRCWGRAHTPGGAHMAGQGAQLGHSIPGQLSHGVSAYEDGGRHVRHRAALEGEAHHVRLVVG